MKTGIGRQLDPNRRSKSVEDFESSLKSKIIGQDAAIDAIVDIFQKFSAGLHPPFRPIGNLLFLGPTGTGKTRVVEAIAESLFGDERALIKVDCGEFQHSHEISKLIGSPPGYLGHRETHPVFTQEAINQWHTENLRLTLILFDEIEKASDALWQLLLGILDKGTLTLGDNRRVDMSCCVILMTSNIGAEEMRAKMGFATAKIVGLAPDIDAQIQATALEAAKKKFSPEFMNRIDKSVVFKTLHQGHLEQILELELNAVQQRILQAAGSPQFIFGCTDDVKRYLLREGTDTKYGVRHLKRVLERTVVSPLSNLIATEQINIGDFIRIAIDTNKEFVFTVESENSLVPVMLAKFNHLGLRRARKITPPTFESAEPSPAMKQAKKKLREAEERLAEARAARKMLDDLDAPETPEVKEEE